jgi:uncharacterized protein YbjT (DUF2867 family)
VPRSVLLAGATGLVGGEILRQLTEDDGVGEIRVLARRPLEGVVPKKAEVIVTDFEVLEASVDWFRVEQVFCALGTTIRKAGSEDAFRRVDLELPRTIATLSRAEGARHFLFVSAIGADPRSRIFYSRVKGELEAAVSKLGFPAVTIARPSVLVGPRNERRMGELLLKRAGFLLPPKWKPVGAGQVAAGLVRAAREDAPGVHVLDNIALRREVP